MAACPGNDCLTRMLLGAAPEAALLKNSEGNTPLELALRPSGNNNSVQVASILLQAGPSPLPPTDKLLHQMAGMGERGIPLYPLLIARQPLAAAEWALVPAPCPGLGAALPAVLARSAVEAGLLVGHLPIDERLRLRTAALCLAYPQQLIDMPLPTPIVWRILATSAA